jgi:hypothetical protein
VAVSNETDAPYREPGERPALSDETRRYFTKNGDVVKGPYDHEAIVRSLKSGRMKLSTLVRGEDEEEWRPAGTDPRFARTKTAPTGRGMTHDDRAAIVEQGSFVAGFAAGFFGGCIGAFLVATLATGSETKRGAWIGFIAQACLGIVLRLALMSHSQP